MNIDDYFMDVARLTGQLSLCKRLQVGAVAVRDNRIIVTGYNGTLPGDTNECEDVLENGELVTKFTVEHAERNLIAYAAKEGIPLKGASLYLTHAPCIDCAKAIINSGINSLIWLDVYRDTRGIDFLKRFKITTRKYQ